MTEQAKRDTRACRCGTTRRSGSRRLVIAFWVSIAVSFALSQIEYAIDGKTSLTIFSYSYAPHHLAARYIAVVNALVGLVSFVLVGMLAARWLMRRYGRAAR